MLAENHRFCNIYIKFCKIFEGKKVPAGRNTGWVNKGGISEKNELISEECGGYCAGACVGTYYAADDGGPEVLQGILPEGGTVLNVFFEEEVRKTGITQKDRF